MDDVQATEYEVKYQIRGSNAPFLKRRFFAPDREKAGLAWMAWITDNGGKLRDYIYISERECTNEPITLEVKDIKQDQRGKIG